VLQSMTLVNVRNVDSSGAIYFASNTRLLNKVKKSEDYFFTLVTRSETH
jgi:hypothetical protein